MKKYVALFISIMSIGILEARDVKTRSEGRFERLLERYPYVVALFYQENGNGQTKNLLRMFNAVSEKDIYKEADIRFIAVSINNENMQEVSKTYSIKRLPSIMTFDNGAAATGDQLTGYGVTRQQLQQYIDDSFADVFEELQKQEKKEREERRRRAERRRDDDGPVMYFNYGYPYYGYGPYYGGYPYYGGGYWGYPYRGYRRGGVSFGIGFGF